MIQQGLLLLLWLSSSALYAAKADVIDATVSCNRSCTFHVTVRHADSGWDHYANQWQIVAADGAILATRVLYG